MACLDETSRQLLAHTRPPLAAGPGQPHEYERRGVCNLFLVCEPLRGWRDVMVSARRTRCGRLRRRAIAAADAAPWRGPVRRYDILKEGTIATAVILALTFGLAGLLSSPDVPPVTIATWARVAPADFLGTAASELNGTSETATYGPPTTTSPPAASRCCSPRPRSPASPSRSTRPATS